MNAVCPYAGGADPARPLGDRVRCIPARSSCPSTAEQGKLAYPRRGKGGLLNPSSLAVTEDRTMRMMHSYAALAAGFCDSLDLFLAAAAFRFAQYFFIARLTASR